MKPCSISELDKLVQHLSFLEESRLQEILVSPNSLGLGFWAHQLWWVWIQMDPRLPLLLPLQEPPNIKKSLKKPIGLFLNRHAKGGRWVALKRPLGMGRVLELTIMKTESPSGVEHNCQIEIRLFPHGQNIIVRCLDDGFDPKASEQKQISWHKISELKVATEEPVNQTVNQTVGRTPAELVDQWSQWKSLILQKPKEPCNSLDNRQRMVQKKKKTLQLIQQDVEHKQQKQWFEVGEWLKLEGHLGVPKEWNEYIDSSQSLSWNIQNCFSRAKELREKIKNAQTKAHELALEIANLESAPAENVQEKEHLPSAATERKQKANGSINTDAPNQWIQKTGAKVRTFSLKGVQAYLGKSAKDNITLLRHANPWDLWLHLKDYPSGHAILRRNRNQKISDQDLVAIAQWLIQETQRSLTHGSFDVIIAECRHVLPIKGDRLGRVTYRQERVIRVG